jgi:hypothetical protein
MRRGRARSNLEGSNPLLPEGDVLARATLGAPEHPGASGIVHVPPSCVGDASLPILSCSQEFPRKSQTLLHLLLVLVIFRTRGCEKGSRHTS